LFNLFLKLLLIFKYSEIGYHRNCQVHCLKRIYLLLLFIIIIIVFLVVCFGNDRVLVLIIEDKAFALIVDVFAFGSVVVGLTVVFRAIIVDFGFISLVFKN
jgi:hypothetical protein